MILDSIELVNFRQYYGRQKIEFSRADDQNVTVIHGENGHGKTALLNAFSWCLYGVINLPFPNRLLNERAEMECAVGQPTEVSVTLSFDHDNKSYTVTRKMTYLKTEQGSIVNKNAADVLEVEIIDEKGVRRVPQNPQNTIDSILPEQMREYFFFDGERIDNLSKEEGSQEIQMAIRNLMGLEVLERSIVHLDEARRRFRSEQKEWGDEELKREIAKEEQLEEAIEARRGEIEILKSNLKAILKTIEELEDRLRTLQDSRELQEKRDTLTIAKLNLEDQIKDLEEQMLVEINTNGHLAFANGLLRKSIEVLDGLRKKGEVPAGIKQSFVDDLLETQVCICGRELKPGTDAYKTVLDWRERAGDNELESRFIELYAIACNRLDKRGELFVGLQGMLSNKDALVEQRKDVIEAIDEISQELSNRNSEEVSDLEKKRSERIECSRKIERNIHRQEFELERLEKELNQVRTRIRQLRQKEEKAQLALKRSNACEEACDALKTIYITLSNFVRDRLQTGMDEVYRRFLRKGYRAIIDDNYTLRIVKEEAEGSRRVPMSQGERQITSLAFIGAIVDMAKRQYLSQQNLFFRGGIYPIVMDSPFSALDPDHKARVANGIHTLARQVILMVTDSQWEGQVEEGLGKYVGRRYLLRNYTPKTNNAPAEYTIVEER